MNPSLNSAILSDILIKFFYIIPNSYSHLFYDLIKDLRLCYNLLKSKSPPLTRDSKIPMLLSIAVLAVY